MATEFDTASNQYQHYRFCYDNGHSQWLESAKQCFDFWQGNQWSAADRAKLIAENRPALTLNVVESLVRSMKGVHKALRNDVRFVPVSGATMEDANVRNQLWMHIQQANDMDFLESSVYEKGLIMDRAYYDVRVQFNDNMQGDVVLSSPRSQDVILDPSIDVYDPKKWPRVIQRRWTSYDDIRGLYGKEKADAVGLSGAPTFYDYEDQFMGQQMGALPYYAMSDIYPSSKGTRGHLILDHQYYVMKLKEHFIDLSTGDTSEIPETWERARIKHVLETVPNISVIKREVQTVRWVVTCGSVVLHDEDSPYRWFTTVPFFPSFVDGIAVGAVRSLLDPQMMYNKITSQELHIINTTANSGWKVKKGALKNMSIQQLEERGAKSGFVAELDDVSNMEKIQPNQTPQGHDRLSFKADGIMRNLAGISNQGRGFAREDVAGEAIMANQAAQEVNFAGWLGNLHYSKMLVARRAVDCAATYMTETRELLINKGTALVPNIQTLTLNQPNPENPDEAIADGRPRPPSIINDVSRGKYSAVLVPSPMRASMSEGDFKLLMEMREMGMEISDAMLIELSPAINKMQIIEKMQGDSNERDAAARAAAEAAAAQEADLTAAKAEKERTAAKLNSARADKFAVESVSDPDASYERVEKARIELDAAQEARRLDLQERKQNQDYLVARESNAIKRVQAKRSAAGPTKKPAPQKRK